MDTTGLMTLAFLSAPGPMEIAVVLVIVLVVFGPGKLPEVFKALGSGLRQFKEAANPNVPSVVNTQSTPALEQKLESQQSAQEPATEKTPALQNV